MEEVQSTTQTKWLEKPIRVADQVWPEGTVPAVSVFCLTYNHKEFIRETIEGFLMQETTFPVEIYIHDDASTDGTAGILQEYAERYPRLFRIVLQKHNQFSSKRFAFFFEHLKRQRGEFVAICEGDDLWISPGKLQVQVRSLQGAPRASGCFHCARVTDEKGNWRDTYPPPPYQRDRIFEDIYFNYWLPTCSLMFRSAALPEDFAWTDALSMGDVPLLSELCARGPLLFIDETLSVYRQHLQGTWSQESSERKVKATIELYDRVEKRFGADGLTKMRQTRKNYYAQLFGLLVERKAYAEALACLAKYLTLSPSRGPLWATQKSNILRLLTLGAVGRSRC